MTQYGGIDLLLIPPNAVTSWGSSATRPVDRTANAQGNVVTTTTGVLTTAFTLTWNVATRADLTALRTVLDARLGRLVPIWIPTYQRDIDFIAVVPFYGNVLTASPYSALLATAPHTHYWIARSSGGAGFTTLYANQSMDPADGTHVWNTSPGAGPSSVNNGVSFSLASSAGAVWSRLRYCRMASDSYRVDVLGAASVVTADFLEVAGELAA